MDGTVFQRDGDSYRRGGNAKLPDLLMTSAGSLAKPSERTFCRCTWYHIGAIFWCKRELLCILKKMEELAMYSSKAASFFEDKSQFRSVVAAECNSVGESIIIKALVTRIRPQLCDTYEPLHKVFGTAIATMTSIKWELCDAGVLGASCSRWELTLSSIIINALDISFFYPYVITKT